MHAPKEPAAGGLFIVDNSDELWKGLKYLHDWTKIASAFDIATGFFEIGALLALETGWQKLDKIRILLGDEMTARTRQALLEGIRERTKAILDTSIEQEKEANDFLAGVPAIVEGMRSGKIECKVYAKRKFHAKAYITHPKVAVIGSVALVGSSNFTVPGLTQNVELNIQVRAPGDVTQLQEWFERHWAEGENISDDIIRVMERQIAAYSPFQVYAKALQELFKSKELPPESWEKTQSKMYPELDQYQKEAYQSMLKISHQHRGAFLCDGVGLGKTFVGLLLIERLIVRDRKRVLLLVPKSGRVAVWERSLRKFLPDLFRGFSNLKIFNHTDLMRGGDFPEELQRMKDQADVILIDEAHHFRNRGLASGDDGEIRSRYWQLYDLAENKTVFLLTATPVNNHLRDFQHLIELFSRIDQPNSFSTTVGIHALPAYFNKLEKQLLQIVTGSSLGELFDQRGVELEQVLFEDKLFRELVVQRSRAYVRASQEQNGGPTVTFPEKEPPRVVEYSVKKTYGHLLGKMEKAFAKEKPLFALALYYPLAYWKGDPTTLLQWDINRQKQLVRLIRILFLKRFESSIVAFESSCQTLLIKLLAFLRANIDPRNPVEVKRLEKWEAQNEELLAHVKSRRSELRDEEQSEESELGDEFIDLFDPLPREDYKIDEIFNETYSDLETVVDFLEEIQGLDASHDDKLKSLIKLLTKDAVLKKNKVLIFTEFMSTARYLKKELQAANIHGVDEIDSSSSRDRADVIQEFAPYYNESSSTKLVADERKEIRILISTDVLSEGLNLQDATRLINYDLHWNPVRLMQRIGRVDRRMSPAIEKQLVSDHPEQAALRGKVVYWNFLPPGELEHLLRLYQRVAFKTLRISKVFGIEGKKLLKPTDDYDALHDFLHTYEGEATPIEKLHLEYQELLKENPALEQFLDTVPLRLFSGKKHPEPNTRAVFFCYRLPAEDKTTDSPEKAWEGLAGRTGWYLYSLEKQDVIEDPGRIADIIRSKPETPRVIQIEKPTLREIRLKIEKHIKNTYLKQVQAPVGVRPTLKCWMELH
ncbi:MAG: phospholipase D-like domain-containing protein [Verrucomicrobiota bacterium]|nr:phospholipase D-like domain-containing protein [Verrucomicrobiota bacterium]